MNRKQVHIAVAVMFFAVGVLGAWYAWRTQNYINATLRRDSAQEQCAADTVSALRTLTRARELRDEAMEVVLDKLARNERPITDDYARWRDEVVRPLPDVPYCNLGPL